MNHPRWNTIRYATKCDMCGARITKGQRVLYAPTREKYFCTGCGITYAAEWDRLERERRDALMDESCLTSCL